MFFAALESAIEVGGLPRFLFGAGTSMKSSSSESDWIWVDWTRVDWTWLCAVKTNCVQGTTVCIVVPLVRLDSLKGVSITITLSLFELWISFFF